MSIKIKDLPEAERPYEKLELNGEKNLSNAELLAIIIKTGTKEETSVQIAQRILNLNQNTKNDTLNFLKDLSIEDFMQIKGIGKVKAIQLKAICELSVRMSKPSNYKTIKIKKPQDIAKICLEELQNEKREIGRVYYLNIKNIIIKQEDIAIGGTNYVNLSIKEIVAKAVSLRASKMILVHNHPSGDSTPSKQDITFTDELYNAAKLLKIDLIDHIIIGNKQYTSIYAHIEKLIQEIKNKTTEK